MRWYRYFAALRGSRAAARDAPSVEYDAVQARLHLSGLQFGVRGGKVKSGMMRDHICKKRENVPWEMK